MLDVLFQYGPLTVRTFTLFMAAGFLFAGYFFLRFLLRKKLNAAFISGILLWMFLLTFLGGRLFYIAEHLNFFTQHPWQTFFVWDLHFSFFGSIYAFLLTLFYFCQQNKENFWLWL